MTDIKKDVSIVVRVVDQASAAIKTVANNTKSAFSGLSNIAKGIASNWANIHFAISDVVNITKSAIVVSMEMINAWAKEEGELSRLNGTLKRHGYEIESSRKVVDKSVDSLKAKGIQEEISRANIQKLVEAQFTLTDAITLNKVAIAQSITTKQGDITASTSLVDAIYKLTKGGAGATRQIISFGINLKGTETRQELLNKAMEQGSKNFGRIDEYAKTTKARLVAFGEVVDDVKEAIGKNLVSAIAVATGGMGDLGDATMTVGEKLVTMINKVMMEVMPKLFTIFNKAREVYEAIGGMEGATKVGKRVKRAGIWGAVGGGVLGVGVVAATVLTAGTDIGVLAALAAAAKWGIGGAKIGSMISAYIAGKRGLKEKDKETGKSILDNLNSVFGEEGAKKFAADEQKFKQQLKAELDAINKGTGGVSGAPSPYDEAFTGSDKGAYQEKLKADTENRFVKSSRELSEAQGQKAKNIEMQFTKEAAALGLTASETDKLSVATRQLTAEQTLAEENARTFGAQTEAVRGEIKFLDAQIISKRNEFNSKYGGKKLNEDQKKSADDLANSVKELQAQKSDLISVGQQSKQDALENTNQIQMLNASLMENKTALAEAQKQQEISNINNTAAINIAKGRLEGEKAVNEEISANEALLKRNDLTQEERNAAILKQTELQNQLTDARLSDINASANKKIADGDLAGTLDALSIKIESLRKQQSTANITDSQATSIKEQLNSALKEQADLQVELARATKPIPKGELEAAQEQLNLAKENLARAKPGTSEWASARMSLTNEEWNYAQKQHSIDLKKEELAIEDKIFSVRATGIKADAIRLAELQKFLSSKEKEKMTVQQVDDAERQILELRRSTNIGELRKTNAAATVEDYKKAMQGAYEGMATAKDQSGKSNAILGMKRAEMQVQVNAMMKEIALQMEAGHSLSEAISSPIVEGFQEGIDAAKEQLAQMEIYKNFQDGITGSLRDAIKTGLEGGDWAETFKNRLKQAAIDALTDALMMTIAGNGMSLGGLFGGGGMKVAGAASSYGGIGMLGGGIGGMLGGAKAGDVLATGGMGVGGIGSLLGGGMMGGGAGYAGGGIAGGGGLFGGLFGGGKGGVGGGKFGGLFGGGGLSTLLGVGALVSVFSGLFGKKGNSQIAPVQALDSGFKTGMGTGGSIEALRGSEIFQRSSFSSRNRGGRLFADWASTRFDGGNSLDVNVVVKPSNGFDVEVQTRLNKSITRNDMRGAPNRTGFNHG